MAPITMLAPTSTQINFEQNVFSEKAVYEQARRDIATLLSQSQAKLPEQNMPHRIIQLIKIDADAAHLDKIVEIYRKVVDEENQRLRVDKVPIQMAVTNTGGSMYFAVANYEPVEKQHMEFPMALNLKGTKQEDYVNLIKSIGFVQEDEAQLLKIIPEIYRRAEAGQLDISNVTINRGQDGNLRIEEREVKVTAPDLTLSEETYHGLSALIGERMQKASARYKQNSPRIQLLGDAIISVCRELATPQTAIDGIKTSEELASAMLDYQQRRDKGENVQPPTANCVEYSLLVNELLKREQHESSILSIHAIDQDGNEMKGHATAAVVADGWLIDPALKGEAIKINGITLDKNNPTYASFSKKMNGRYLNELKDSAHPESIPTALEFVADRSESEIKSFYLLEEGARREGNNGSYFIEARELNPKNFYASYLAGKAYGNNEEEAAAYRDCATLNPDLYLANDYAARGLNALGSRTGSKEVLEEAYSYSKKAADIEPGFVFAQYRCISIGVELGKQDEYEQRAQKVYDSLPENSPYKKMFEPYLAKK